jgi:hypothetical protein
MMLRRGRFFGGYGPAGRLVQVYPLDPRVEDIHVATLARGLGGEARYINATLGFWPVAAHTVECSRLPCSDGSPPPPLLSWKRLHHDDSEAVFRDLPAPLKKDPGMDLGVYLASDAVLMDVMADRFDLPRGFHEEVEVTWADEVVLRTEIRDLRQPHDWSDPRLDGPILAHRLWPTNPIAAERRWLRRFAELADALGRYDDAIEARVALVDAEAQHRAMLREMAKSQAGGMKPAECLACGRMHEDGAQFASVVVAVCTDCAMVAAEGWTAGGTAPE